MAGPPLHPEVRKLLKKQHTVAGTSIPSYRLLDILATEDADIGSLIVRFKELKEAGMRKAFHDMAVLLREMEKAYMGGAAAAGPAPREDKGAAMRRDAEAVKSAPQLKVFMDGACSGNPGPMAIAIVIADGKGTPLYEHCEPTGRGTNNVAEYQALIGAMQRTLELGRKEAAFFSDSELIVNQVMGRWKIKDARLAELAAKATELRKSFARFSLTAIPRERNKRADILAASVLEKDNEEEKENR